MKHRWSRGVLSRRQLLTTDFCPLTPGEGGDDRHETPTTHIRPCHLDIEALALP